MRRCVLQCRPHDHHFRWPTGQRKVELFRRGLVGAAWRVASAQGSTRRVIVPCERAQSVLYVGDQIHRSLCQLFTQLLDCRTIVKEMSALAIEGVDGMRKRGRIRGKFPGLGSN